MEGYCIYKNPNAPIEERIKDLLSRMTLQEKLAQMAQIDCTVASSFALKDLGIGAVSFSFSLWGLCSVFFSVFIFHGVVKFSR